MKFFCYLLLILLAFSCSSKQDDPLIIPPNFTELPDINNPQKVTPQQSKADVERLKELLLQSD